MDANGSYRMASTTFMLLLLLLSFPISADAQSSPPPAEAEVTFYSPGVTPLGGLPGRQPGAFKGRLFDDARQLTFVEPGHFITFRLASGTHVLTAASWMAKSAKKGAHVSVDLKAGKHYFVELSTYATYLGAGGFRIQEVNCRAAQGENLTTKPLEATHLRPDGAALAITESTFPHCNPDEE